MSTGDSLLDKLLGQKNLSRRRKISAGVFMLGVLLLASCGGVINLPRPAISTLNPASVAAGATTFTLAVMGSGFAPSSQILFNGSPRATIFLSETELTTLVNPNDPNIATAQTVTVTVFTPAPGGGTSNSVTLTVNPTALPVPQISTITPSSVQAGAGGANVTIVGTNFASESVATVNGANRPTRFVSSTQLTVTLQSSDVTAGGELQIAVLNPPAQNVTPPGGGISNSVVLNVVNPSPVIRGVTPPSLVAGSTTTTAINVSGSGFDSASVVLVNGTGRPTAFSSSSSLVAQLASGDTAAAGTYTVQVVNPAPGGGATAILHFSVVPSASGAGLPDLVDVATDGAQANNGASPPNQAGPSMDGSARYVVFTSSSTNLLETTTINPPPNPLTNGTSNIFLRDTCLGSSSCVPRETLINVGPAGIVANGPSFSPVVNSNGANVVAYTSLATDLVSGFSFDGTTPQVFLSTSCINAFTGCTPNTSLISVASDGVTAGSGASGQASISSDGRFVAFASKATNLVSGATTGSQEIYLRDTCAGAGSMCTPTTLLVSVAPDGVTPADGSSAEPVVVSGKSGQFVAFTSTATNLVSGSSGAQEIYRVGLCIGISTGCKSTSAQLISTPDGTTFADGASVEPTMTPDGRVVAFASTATVLGVASGGMQEIYERDTCQGITSGCTPATTLVSVAADGTTPANALSENPSLGNTGQLVAFASLATNLVTVNTNGLENVYVRNSCVSGLSSCKVATAMVSRSALGAAGNGASLNPVISGAGHIVAFYSSASNLVNNDLNGFPDIFQDVSTF